MTDDAALLRELEALGDPADAEFLQGYFKTGPGEYGEGDVFIGVRMPAIRKAIKPFRDLQLEQIERVLASPVHEHRMAALLICAEQAKRARRAGDGARHKLIYDFYLAHADRVNNWDLVDVTCRDVVGEYLLSRQDWRPLKKLARSKLLWERRIAMISTWSFIRAGEVAPTFELAELLVDDPHDLMHKATGWMLRDAGKRDPAALEEFLARHAKSMPRTALRYAIEKMPSERRRYWLARGRQPRAASSP